MVLTEMMETVNASYQRLSISDPPNKTSLLIWKDRCQATNGTTFRGCRGGHLPGARPASLAFVPFC
jgi:hypothetical protein